MWKTIQGECECKRIKRKNIDSFDGGEVKSLESENQLATFYFNQNGGIAINYNDHPELDTQIAIITIINSFVTDVKNTLTRKASHQFQSKKAIKMTNQEMF